MVAITLGSAVRRGVSTTEASWWVLMAPPQKAVRTGRFALGRKRPQLKGDQADNGAWLMRCQDPVDWLALMVEASEELCP
jgi:hypothetical protein